MRKILFVCSGNTCRSPMAEGFLKTALDGDTYLYGLFNVASAGIAAYNGENASPNAVKALQDGWNTDISNHCASTLQAKDIENSFIILTMTRSHKEYILLNYPDAHDKVFTLKEYAYGKSVCPGYEQYDYSLDTADPYGMSLHMYSLCAFEIKQAVEKLVEKLKII